MFEYVGVLHIHSVFSDGSGDVKEIIDFANEVGLDFLILTDHNTLRAKTEGYEKWHNRTLFMVGCEINDRENKNHLLAFGINQTYSTRLHAKEYVKKVKEAGGISFLAHPNEKRESMDNHPPYPWTEWDTNDFTGIEIWNHMSQWMEGLTEQNKYNYFIHPLRSVTHPPEDTLKIWDKLNQSRRVVGIGGVDAHAHKVNLLGFFEVEVFPYKVLFKSIRTHVLLDEEIEPIEDVSLTNYSITKILKAMELGRCFVSNNYLGDAKGFRFFAKLENNIYQMGDLLPLQDNLKLKIKSPDITSVIKIIRNGDILNEIEGNQAELIINEKGAYRVEVYKNGLPWIFSNHIRIGL